MRTTLRHVTSTVTIELTWQVKRGKFKFPSPYWDNVSEEAKDLVSSLLTLSPDDRLDAQQCLDHPCAHPLASCLWRCFPCGAVACGAVACGAVVGIVAGGGGVGRS